MRSPITAFFVKLPVVLTVGALPLFAGEVQTHKKTMAVFNEPIPAWLRKDFQEASRKLCKRYPQSKQLSRRIDQLLQMRLSFNPDASYKAWVTTLDMGYKALPALIGKLSDPSPGIRLEAVVVIRNIIRRQPEEQRLETLLAPLIARSLFDSSERVRIGATNILFLELRSEYAISIVEPWLRGSLGAQQACAYRGLLVLGHLEKVPVDIVKRLIEVNTSTSPFVGDNEYRRLKAPGDLFEQAERAAARLRERYDLVPKLSEEMDRLVRELGKIERARLYSQTVGKEDRTKAYTILHKFETMGMIAAWRLAWWLAYPEAGREYVDGREFRRAAMRAFAVVVEQQPEKPNPEVAAILVRSLYDRDATISLRAMLLLRRVRSPELASEFEKWVQSHDPAGKDEMRFQAAKALIDLGLKDRVPKEVLYMVEKNSE